MVKVNELSSQGNKAFLQIDGKSDSGEMSILESLKQLQMKLYSLPESKRKVPHFTSKRQQELLEYFNNLTEIIL